MAALVGKLKLDILPVVPVWYCKQPGGPEKRLPVFKIVFMVFVFFTVIRILSVHPPITCTYPRVRSSVLDKQIESPVGGQKKKTFMRKQFQDEKEFLLLPKVTYAYVPLTVNCGDSRPQEKVYVVAIVGGINDHCQHK